ncbi:rCG63039 [Rattus norvegicus]|uniref:RCG63039 n=1 Tax=Rattus norvegicus TaxID=10116 RepID=A6HWF5_RAT|nr:rCG63039 [Rattus norvegicus]
MGENTSVNILLDNWGIVKDIDVNFYGAFCFCSFICLNNSVPFA